MSAAASRTRDAIFLRLDPLTVVGGFEKVRMVPVALMQPDDLPSISISLLSERMTANGDDNAGAPIFDSDLTIGISIVRGFDAAVTLDEKVDADVDLIEQLLLCDSHFTQFWPNMRFAKSQDISKASLSNGIIRIDCARSGADGTKTLSAELLIPANRAGMIVKSLVDALQDIERQMADHARSSVNPN